jgi:hypothetical protein
VAKWWTNVEQTKVHAADGTTITHPMLTDDATTSPLRNVFYLYGSFFGGSHTHSATVPQDTPIFVPILPIEFSNFDTTTGNDPNGTLPGANTAQQLSGFAAQAAEPALGPGGEVHLSVDGRSITVSSYRQIAPTFSYVLPATDNVDQFFFGQDNLQGRVAPAEADGFYAMLRPLSPGQHVITFGGSTPGGPLGPLNVDITYTINVVRERTSADSQAAPAPIAAAVPSTFGDTPISSTDGGFFNDSDAAHVF